LMEISEHENRGSIMDWIRWQQAARLRAGGRMADASAEDASEILASSSAWPIPKQPDGTPFASASPLSGD
jgi:hypothetical protein